jgi:hypothetical protein
MNDTVEQITAQCRCGREMQFEIPDGLDRDDAIRLSKLIRCNACAAPRRFIPTPKLLPASWMEFSCPQN